STNVSRVDVTVNRTGLADADYLGSVTIHSNGGDIGVTVMMTVATPPPPLNENLFMLAVNADTYATVQQIDLNPTTTLVFDFTSLPNGRYILVCGSDDNGDDTICG